MISIMLAVSLMTFSQTNNVNLDYEQYVKNTVKKYSADLNSKSEIIRVNAAKQLANLIHKRAIKPLLKCLKDKSPFVRRIAVQGLGNVKAFGAVDSILVLIKKDKDLFVVKFALDSLVRIGNRQVVNKLKKLKPKAHKLLAKSFDIAIENLSKRK